MLRNSGRTHLEIRRKTQQFYIFYVKIWDLKDLVAEGNRKLGAIFEVFGMTQLGIEPATSQSVPLSR